ncbi:MAG: YciI family protein [Micrococcales bacterium]
MRFLISVIDTTENSASGSEMAAIDAFNDMLQANGHWIYAAGIEAPANATTIDNRQGLGQVTPGPFVKTAEHQSGFWLIEAPDRATAEALALQGSLACNRKVEVRAFLG